MGFKNPILRSCLCWINLQMVFARRFRWFLYMIITCISCRFCVGSDTISSGQSLFPNQTIISRGQKFELGFFSPVNSTNSYIGIWYKNIPVQTVVWVANRNDPIPSADRNGSRLELSETGLFLSFNSRVVEIARISNATVAIIRDSGNFVLRNGSAGRNVSGAYTLWSSSGHPTDTWLPGSGWVGFNGSLESKLVSWRNLSDPAQGNYSLGMKRNGRAELFIWLNNTRQQWRSGIYQDGRHGLFFDNTTNLFPLVSDNNDDYRYFAYAEADGNGMSRIVIDEYGILTNWSWSAAHQEWIVDWKQPSEKCNSYGFCGANAICDSNNAPPCACLVEFVPKVPADWYLNDFSGGCVRGNRSLCRKGSSEFVNVTNTRLPANPKSLGVGSSDICEFACSKDCSCNAYAFSGVGGCSLYTGDILDLQRLRINGTGRDLHIRMNSAKPQAGNGKGRNLAYALSAVTVTIGAGALIFLLRRRFKRKAYERTFQNLLLLDLNSSGPANNQRAAVENHRGGSEKRDYELPVFSFTSITAATDNFSARNRLGEGGFGPVYKGELANGQFVAVKRLSKMSGQGLEEFRNETELIAKLQHRNLVRILGCCIQEDEKILVYEYMPNKSLDSFLFDPTKKGLLDWTRRVQIIEGIAQGLLYLHQYSRLRIVHRDLKAGNILLDGDMKPKISDFGMARIFGGNDSQANTKRIVGTYGYMSPEYVSGGTFSIKSDVFAFGVLLLEILSGKKSNGFYDSDSFSLLGHAWKLWQNNETTELLDPVLEVSSSSSLVPLRYIHVGLLCVQESPDERPTMLEVVAMLSNEQTALASPRHPAFTARNTCFPANAGNQRVVVHSANEMTVSLMCPR